MSEGTASSAGPTTGAAETGGSSAAPTGDTGIGSSSETTVALTGSSTGDASTGDASTGEPAGGCGKDPGMPDVAPQTLMVDGMERQYILALPANYDPDKAYPLVFAWHGRGGDGALGIISNAIGGRGAGVSASPPGLGPTPASATRTPTQARTTAAPTPRATEPQTTAPELPVGQTSGSSRPPIRTGWTVGPPSGS